MSTNANLEFPRAASPRSQTESEPKGTQRAAEENTESSKRIVAHGAPICSLKAASSRRTPDALPIRYAQDKRRVNLAG